MTVKELRDALEKYDEDMEVCQLVSDSYDNPNREFEVVPIILEARIVHVTSTYTKNGLVLIVNAG